MATQVAGKEVSRDSRNRLETLRSQIVGVEAKLAGFRTELVAAESRIRDSVRTAARAGGLRFDPLTRYERRMILSQIALDTSNEARDRIAAIALYERLYGRDEVEASKMPKAG